MSNTFMKGERFGKKLRTNYYLFFNQLHCIFFPSKQSDEIHSSDPNFMADSM